MTTDNPSFAPSPGQQDALDAIRYWFEETDAQVFRMFGPAGTGKTTIARLVPEMLGLARYNFAAFSGKAAQVLRSKGCTPAATLHSLVYGAPVNLPAEEKKLVQLLEDLQSAHDFRSSDFGASDPPEGVPITGAAGKLASAYSLEDLVLRISEISSELAQNRSQQRVSGPFLWPLKFEGELETTELLIADEVSMVSDRMATDILSTGCRVLVLGDPEQLPPVGGDGYFTRDLPDVLLHEVHRQALDSPVLALATRVRLGDRVRSDEYATGARSLDYTAFDMILCWRRATRWGAIQHVRNQLGRPAGVPVVGDVVMNLANNKDLGVFNGQTFVVDAVAPGRDQGEYEFTLHEDGSPPVTMFGYAYGFTQQGEKDAEKQRLGWRGDTALLTFAQALTVHKAQGSEYPSVCVMDEGRSMWTMDAQRSGAEKATSNYRRWLYTAITRASSSVVLVRR